LKFNSPFGTDVRHHTTQSILPFPCLANSNSARNAAPTTHHHLTVIPGLQDYHKLSIYRNANGSPPIGLFSSPGTPRGLGSCFVNTGGWMNQTSPILSDLACAPSPQRGVYELESENKKKSPVSRGPGCRRTKRPRHTVYVPPAYIYIHT
jgi:hypothetical protein